MTSYLGTEILLDVPHRVLIAQESHEVSTVVMDAQTGVRTVEVRDPVPARSRELEMLATDLGEAYELREFLHRRRGRQKALWLPSWQQDLVLDASELATSGTITVKACGYASNIWPLSPAKRHLMLRSRGGTTLLRHVDVAVDNGDGTETLTLTGPNGETQHGVAIDTSWLVSFLRLVRLDRDEVEFSWQGGVATVRIPIREIPQEVPA